MATDRMEIETANTLTLISADGVEIPISREAAKLSQILKDMMEDLPEEETNMPVPLTAISSPTLKLVVEWCEHYNQEQKSETEENVDGKKEIPAWDAEFLTFEDERDIFPICNAANFMDIKALLEYTVKTIASHLKGKTVEEMRAYLAIESDFTPEEEEEIRKENEWAEDR